LRLLFELLPEVVHALGEVDLDATVVYQDVVHFEIGLFACRITEEHREGGQRLRRNPKPNA